LFHNYICLLSALFIRCGTAEMWFLGYNLMGSVMQVEPSTVSKRRWARW